MKKFIFPIIYIILTGSIVIFNSQAFAMHKETIPFDPAASILAGSWYLGKMYDQAVMDLKANPYKRHKKDSWTAALEYYFAVSENSHFDSYNRSFDKGFE